MTMFKEINKILNQIILKSKESIVNLEEEEVKKGSNDIKICL